MVKRISPQRTGNPIIDRNQDQVAQAVNEFLNNNIPSGITLKDVTIETSDTLLSVGFQSNGWLILKKNANADIWQVSSDKLILTLKASTSVLVDLYIF